MVVLLANGGGYPDTQSARFGGSCPGSSSASRSVPSAGVSC